jgi:hypothetical protein
MAVCIILTAISFRLLLSIHSFSLFCSLMKKLLAGILLLIISFQALPVKELGKILYLGLITEEIHEIESDTEGPAKIKPVKLETTYKPDNGYQPVLNRHLYIMAMIAVHRTDHFLRQYVPDILTPPPNLF